MRELNSYLTPVVTLDVCSNFYYMLKVMIVDINPCCDEYRSA